MAEIYVRPKDKVETYLEKLMKQYGGCKCTESAGLKSRYYTINTKVLRVSDHIGTTNDAHVSIIVPAFRATDQQYIIHAHRSGQISIVPYDKVKEVVRSFFYLSSIFAEVVVDRGATEIGEDKEEKKNVNRLIAQFKEIERYKNKAQSKEKQILGVPVTKFTEGQLKPILGLVNKIKNKEKNVENESE